MSAKCRRNAAVIGSLSLLCSLIFADWKPLTSGVNGELYSVHFPEGTQVGYAVGAGMDSVGGFVSLILKTTDGGAAWQQQNAGTIDVLNSVYFKDNNTGFAVGSAGTALRTTDGGTTWTPMTVPGNEMLTSVKFPENGQVGYIGVYPRTANSKLFKTTDGGGLWDSVAVGGAMSWSRGIGMATDNIGVAVGNGGMVYATQDGFGSATVQGPRTIADLTAAAFSPDDPLKGYLIGLDTANARGVVRYTANGGTPLWDSVKCPAVANLHGIDMPTSDVAYICGADGFIGASNSATDIWKTTVPTGLSVPIFGLSFPNGADTGYAVGAAGTILRTYDGGKPWIPGVAEGKAPAVTRAGIRVVSNPSRHGIALHSDAAVSVSVFDAAGRVVVSQAATRGLNFLPLPTGAYFVKAGAATARAVVTD